MFLTGVGALMLRLSATGAAQAPGSGLETFQRFMQGKEGVKEAVVYRRISRPDGTLVNEEWLRFGYQDQGNTWYAQRLAPSTNTPSKLAPRPENAVQGASFTHLWAITDTDVHVAKKGLAAGSGPQQTGAMARNFILRTLALGLPCDALDRVRWEGTSFTAPVVSKWLPDGTPLETNLLTGRLILDANGRPARAEYSGVGALEGGAITYEYAPEIKGLPARFTLTLKSGRSYRFEFLTLSLGTTNLETSGGYVPSMFADVHQPRYATLWTNNLPYNLIEGKTIPAFETSNPKRTGSFVLGTVALGTMIVLALWYWRSARKEKTEMTRNK